MEVSSQLHAPAALPPGKEPLVPFGQSVFQGLCSIEFSLLYANFRSSQRPHSHRVFWVQYHVEMIQVFPKLQ